MNKMGKSPSLYRLHILNILIEGGIMDKSLGYSMTNSRNAGIYRIGGLPQNKFVETESLCQLES